MKTNEIIFIRCRNHWRGIYEAVYRFRGSNRHYSDLYYLHNGKWQSGCAIVTGTRSSPIMIAPQAIQDGLNAYVKLHTPIVHNGK